MPDPVLAALRAVVLAHDPASPLWFTAVPRPAAPADVAAEFLAAAGRGVELTLFALAPADGPEVPGPGRSLDRLGRQFPAGVALVPETAGSAVELRGPAGEPIAARVHRFLDDASFRVLVLYAPAAGTRTGPARLIVDTSDVSDPQIVDLDSGASRAAGLYIPDRRTDTTRLDVTLGGSPGLLTYRRFATPAAGGAAESLEVTGADERTVEEIVARHQAVQQAQDDRLQRYLADARLDLHFSIGASRSLDVTFLQGFFFERGRGPEWEQREMLVNGVRWRSRRIPELPLIQPDKVVTLPLEVHLDRRYRYRLQGEEIVDGYPTWRVAFAPLDADAPLYRGTVWIEQGGYARVRMSVRQRGLAPPFVSNDEVDHFTPVRGPDGRDYWLLARVDGAQLYTTAGRSFAVNREVRFSGFRINPEEFERQRAEAYASEHQMLRETDAGYRYLKKGPDGERVVDDDLSVDQLFLVGGAFYDRSVDFPIPLAGISYINLGLQGTDRQLNLFFAGALLLANYTDPTLFDSRLEGTVDAFGVAFDGTDRVRVDGEEIEAWSVDRKNLFLRPSLGANLGSFWKVRGSYGLEWALSSRAADTAGEFVVPVDTFVHTLGVDVNFNRRAWSLHLGAGASRRQDWEPWGTPEDQAAFDASARDFVRWEASFGREFYLPSFQKIRLAAEWVDGDHLDRFSEYQFDFFGDTALAGFSGSGIRFDQGAFLRAVYSFNFFDKLRFEVSLEQARVRDRGAAGDWGDHTGVGLAGNFIGPWGTILRVDWGYALRSGIPAVEGEQEFQLLVLKLF